MQLDSTIFNHQHHFGRAYFMRISAKARYGLSAMIYFAMRAPQQTKFTVLEISEALKISKIYLEQVFTPLKLAGIVQATKGPQGGYSLTRDPMDITVYDVLAATETSLFEPTPSTVEDSALHIESVMHESVFLPLDQTVRTSLSHITIRQLADRANEKIDTGYMYYL